MRFFKEQVVFKVSIFCILVFSLFVFLDTPSAYRIIEDASIWVREKFGKFYLYLGFACVLFILALSLSPFGKKKLGGAKAQPEFSRWPWFAMLYSTGMGAGILLRAVQEPTFMLHHPPIKLETPNNILALEYTFYHWGITAWAFYGLFAIIIGYYLFDKHKKLLPSATIEDHIPSKKVATFIDILAVLTTVFGLVGAIALGATQISGGIEHMAARKFGLIPALGILTIISGLAFLSVWKGIDKGIKQLSKLNLIITIAILLFVFFQSDIMGIIQSFGSAIFHYFIDFIPMSLAIGDYNPGEAFLTDWTYYYWAFWLAWAPFTGIFIARISKGRTLREILIGVLLIPSLGTFFWFSVFGNSAFEIIESWNGYHGEFDNVFNSIFVFFEAYPLTTLLNMTTVIVLIGFLVTSLDSAIFVLSIFTDKGRLNPSKKHRALWSVLLLVFSIAMLSLGNARPDIDVLVALQKLIIITSIPFSFLLILMAFFYLKNLINEPRNLRN